MSSTTVTFMQELVNNFTILTPILKEHLKDQHGELLPHLLLADIERWIEESISLDNAKPTTDIQGILLYLETAFAAGNPDIHELIAASFLEHIPELGSPRSRLRTLLGRSMTQHLLTFS